MNVLLKVSLVKVDFILKSFIRPSVVDGATGPGC